MMRVNLVRQMKRPSGPTAEAPPSAFLKTGWYYFA